MKLKYSLLNILTIFFLTIGLFLRFVNFPNTPELHVDEMSFGYSAYSWLRTGVDEYGRPPGLVLESLGDWKLALYAYFVWSLVAILGLNEWSIRLPSAIFGLFCIPLTYVLAKNLLGDRRVAGVAALCLTVLPWHIVFSRTANEVTMELFFLMLGVWMYLRWLQNCQLRYLISSAIILSLALISYYPAFVTVPLIAAYLPMLRLDLLKKEPITNLKGVTIASIPLVVTGSMLVGFLLTQPKDRIASTSFWGHESISAEVSQRLITSGLSESPIWWTRMLNNRYVVSLNSFLTNYFAHFDPRYWFIEGEVSHSRYDIPYQGPLYLWMAPFLIIGFAVVVKNVLDGKDLRSLFVIFWLVVAMLPGAMTYEKANLQRSFLAVPALVWLVALGITRVWDLLPRHKYFWRNAGLGVSVAVGITLLAVFYDNYFVHGVRYMPWYRHMYVKELLEKIAVHRKNFVGVYISDMPYLPMFFMVL